MRYTDEQVQWICEQVVEHRRHPRSLASAFFERFGQWRTPDSLYYKTRNAGIEGWQYVDYSPVNDGEYVSRTRSNREVRIPPKVRDRSLPPVSYWQLSKIRSVEKFGQVVTDILQGRRAYIPMQKREKEYE